MRIQGGQTLVDGKLVEADISLDEGDGVITAVGQASGNGRAFDARGLHVLPGIVDIHGDAFERQLMPRPGVSFPVDVALMESDRQCVANGITTVFHGVTCSWEPGLRSIDNARKILGAIEDLEPSFGADTRFHLRYETFNLDAEAEVTGWISEGRVGMLGFNDHLPSDKAPPRTRKIGPMAERAGLSREDLLALVERLRARAEEVPESIARLAAAAHAHGAPMLSHDDMSPEQRRWFRDLKCRVAEFPTTVETAQDATAAGDDIVMGAPNVVRGGSHIGWIGAAEMIARGCCTILASDYYYPAPLLAAFRLAADGVAPLEQAWSYVSTRPAKAAGLADRGALDAGRRADVIAVDASDALRPKLVAAIANGRVVHLSEGGRLQ
ncbi:alpha-D-ribose 1-methylphosphonate 5-triphosphate diphosphatase [Microbacteriaceae bacterium K1510]|nr:alpha-D-ribose 1-methylphosphonate 5-triphosphate diphosphatase [Microbacteriaceae bacterium K1510]